VGKDQAVDDVDEVLEILIRTGAVHHLYLHHQSVIQNFTGLQPTHFLMAPLHQKSLQIMLMLSRTDKIF